MSSTYHSEYYVLVSSSFHSEDDVFISSSYHSEYETDTDAYVDTGRDPITECVVFVCENVGVNYTVRSSSYWTTREDQIMKSNFGRSVFVGRS